MIEPDADADFDHDIDDAEGEEVVAVRWCQAPACGCGPAVELAGYLHRREFVQRMHRWRNGLDHDLPPGESV